MNCILTLYKNYDKLYIVTLRNCISVFIYLSELTLLFILINLVQCYEQTSLFVLSYTEMYTNQVNMFNVHANY